MSHSWNRRSDTTSSRSSSTGGTGYSLFGNGSFDAMSSFASDFPFFGSNTSNNNDHASPLVNAGMVLTSKENNSTRPPVKLLQLADRRSILGSNTTFSDADSIFFNRSITEDLSSSSAIGDIFSFIGNFQSSANSARLLPVSNADPAGSVRPNLTIEDVLRRGQLIDFALDRHGVKFLEDNYPQNTNDEVHKIVFGKLTASTTLFSGLCHNANGNFIVQKLVEFATVDEQRILMKGMVDGGLMEMCKDKFACRVVQLAIQKFHRSIVIQLVNTLSTFDFVAICTDQSAIHVVQRIVKFLPVEIWNFFVHFLYSGDNLMSVCQDKYGCRLVQQVIDKLAENPKLPCFISRLQMLHSLMTCIARNCYRLSSNEFANYVVQYVIKSSGVLEMYRDMIIDKCLLRNLLSMSQDKFASHVIEGAFIFAPPILLTEMMNEIFDGYVKDCDSNRDALDILLFHQYGNYVVQQMILICTSAFKGKEERQLTPSEFGMYATWYEKIKNRVQQQAHRLERFSSGKKIIDSLMKLAPIEPVTLPYPAPSLLELSAHLDDIFPSFLSNPLMF